MKYPKVREAFQFKVYCPEGNMDHGFISINVKTSQDIIIFSTNKDTSKLEEALLKTKRIDWSNKICIDLVNSLILKSLERISRLMDFKAYEVGMLKTLFLAKETKPFGEQRRPSNITLGPVKEEHITDIYNVWPYELPCAHKYFSTFISNDLSYALYLNDKLVAWIFINEYHFLLHLYVLEEYRRRGYAEFLLKIVINEQLGKGNDLYAYVVEGNVRSMSLFLKLGFEIIDDSAYLYVQK